MDYSNRLSLWKNQKFSKEGDAVITATIDIDGRKYYANLWTNVPGSMFDKVQRFLKAMQDECGLKPMISGTLKPADAPKAKPEPQSEPEFDDDIPF